jgi:SWI/SNF-related matrix-associated actin-dependent regulator of chromatin subfamily D
VLGNEQGVREEDLKNSQFFAKPWVGKVKHFFLCILICAQVEEAISVQEGLRVTNAIRTQQGTMG